MIGYVPGARPDFIPAADWAVVTKICRKYDVNPYFIAAIGWHETHWGRLGAGRKGYHLGYGYYPGSPFKLRFKGLKRQVAGACSHIKRKFKAKEITHDTILSYSISAWRAGNPKAWADSVWKIYYNLMKKYAYPKGKVSPSKPVKPPTKKEKIQEACQRIKIAVDDILKNL